MSKKRTVVHETDQNNTINDTIVHNTEQKDPIVPPAEPTKKEKYLALQQKREELKQRQEQAKASKE